MSFDNFNTSEMSRDVKLELQSKIISYFREALNYDNGFVVFEITDFGNYEFDFYYSSGTEIIPRYDETRKETTDRILFTLACSELRKIKQIDIVLPILMSNFYNYITGLMSLYVLENKYDLKDNSNLFKEVLMHE